MNFALGVGLKETALLSPPQVIIMCFDNDGIWLTVVDISQDIASRHFTLVTLFHQRFLPETALPSVRLQSGFSKVFNNVISSFPFSFGTRTPPFQLVGGKMAYMILKRLLLNNLR